jgi:signal transduction histidine kinase
VPIGPTQLVATRAAVGFAGAAISATGAVSRAIGAAAGQLLDTAKPTFEQVFAATPAAPPDAATRKAPITDQVATKIRSLLAAVGFELTTPLTFAVSEQGMLQIEGDPARNDTVHTALAHDQQLDALINQMLSEHRSSGRGEPLRFTVAAKM